ncbi:alpha/beta hydrolase [Conexibacter sp. JD483]|uniref:alpha/beta fold hydrolase n=1 Tax=unclassified Conexibacter TaxID=2627773 RepID=UPI00271E517A|nr:MULTISPECIES: alpha/beta hydrolase [unclassified Conexibacter]MDO8187560.1 alpha/beta hydrolase [Conexibacter sp. CPCC 205706]MDO8198926.1 alpha/beta hydrolase [Conexibacter sp. CPCC 205762]MDR9370367.1 alpha/beta hydrolase [Conexibacter sp. JD483]
METRVVRHRCGDGVEIEAEVRGDGPAVLLLHGYPESRAMWDEVAPVLAAAGRTVVAADLRGYGASSKPAPRTAADATGAAREPGPAREPDADAPRPDATYSKRAMAADQHGLMASLGFDRFDVIGHDRGARVGHRLALDHPQAVRSLAVMDVVPTLHMFEHVDRAMAATYFHWFFLALESEMPAKLIEAAPEVWLRSRFEGRNVGGGMPIAEERYAAYERWFATPEAIAATCADYRAAATVDLDADRADRDAGTKIEAPLLTVWGSESYVGRSFDVVATWQPYAAGTVAGAAIRSDHYMAEERPAETAAVLARFLDQLGATP